MPFKTEEMSPVLVFEVGHSAGEVKEIFRKWSLKLTEEANRIEKPLE